MPDYAHHYEMQMEYQYKYYAGKKVTHYYHVSDKQRKNPLPIEKLKDTSLARLKDRTVVDYSFHKGDYGDSGPGFLGLLLESRQSGSNREWLVVAISNAPVYHCLLDGRWIYSFQSHIEMFNPNHEPWFIQGQGFKIDKDEFSDFIRGSVITDVELKVDRCNITLEKDAHKHLLEILNTDPRLSPWAGATYKVGKEIRHPLPKAFPDDEHMGDYIVFTPEDGIIYL